MTAPKGPAAIAPLPAPTPKPTFAPSPSSAPPGVIDAAAVRHVWPELLAIVRKRRRATEALLTNATALSVDNGVLRLGIGSAPLMRLLSEPVNVENVVLSLKDLLGVDWRIETVVQTPTLDSAAEPDPRDDEPVVTGPVPGAPDRPGGPASALAPPPRDAEAEAISLVQEQLGARRIDPPA